MIELYYAPTPNGWKISIALEEMGLAYRMIPLNLRAGEQFTPEFLAISPNNRIPAIVDTDPLWGDTPVSLFESGAILVYLARKTGKFMPADPAGYFTVLQWVFWQTSGLGPMLGQHGHFKLYAPQADPYAIDRYRVETERLYRVLDRQLAGKEYIVGDYSIADMACWPWVVTNKQQEIDLTNDYPNVRRWYDLCKTRPALRRGYELGRSTETSGG